MISQFILALMINQTSNLLGVVAFEVSNRIEASAREIMKRAGETAAALVVIGYDLGPTNDQLRRVLGLTHSGTVRLIDRLVDDGLVIRKEGEDKREIALYATKRGKALREQIMKERLAAIRPLLNTLTRAEQENLYSLLHKILASMETTDMERRTLCRLCDDRVCTNCPIPADFREDKDL
ncbi:MAG: MarR family transcriptional regulator [Pseudomonadota bacterium]